MRSSQAVHDDLPPARQIRTVWVVVKVWRGVADMAEVYDEQQVAVERAQYLARNSDPLSDDVQVFETLVNTPTDHFE